MVLPECQGARLGISKLGRSVRTVLVLTGGPVMMLRDRVGKWHPPVPLFPEGSLHDHRFSGTRSEMSS